MKNHIKTISSSEIIAMVHNGKLVSIIRGGREYMHGAERPCPEARDLNPESWSKSEITMFPLIGPAKGYSAEVNDLTFPFDQHGVTRHLSWELDDSGYDLVHVVQRHCGEKWIGNTKHQPGRPNPSHLVWPFAYTLEKIIDVGKSPDDVCIDHSVEVSFALTNDSEITMPYMLGWHPGFRFLPGRSIIERDNGEDVYMEDVLEASRTGALLLEDTTSVCYQNGSQGLEVTTNGFRHMMFWSPSPNSGMFCIEPVTHLPKDVNHFTEGEYDSLEPGKTAEYSVVIKPF